MWTRDARTSQEIGSASEGALLLVMSTSRVWFYETGCSEETGCLLTSVIIFSLEAPSAGLCPQLRSKMIRPVVATGTRP